MSRLPFLLACVAAAAMAVAPGCDVPLSERVVEVSNRCDADADCGANARCIEEICVTTAADMANVVIQYDIPPDAPYAPGTTQLASPRAEGQDLSGDGASFYTFYDLKLKEQVEIITSMAVANLPAECSAPVEGLPPFSDALGRVPIRVELTPTAFEFGQIPAGIPVEIYDGAVDPAAKDHNVHLSVPRGTYDVYVTPLIPKDANGASLLSGCELPPRLVRDLALPHVAGGETFDFPVDVVVSSGADDNVFKGSFTGYDLQGWTVDLIDNQRGRALSKALTLPLSVGGHPTEFSLPYWDANNLEREDILLRLTPPETITAQAPGAAEGMPVLLWSLKILVGNNADVSALANPDNQPIAVTANVVAEDTSEPVPAIVTIQSSELFTGFGTTNILYRRTIETQVDGSVAGLELLPGRYTAIIQPVEGDSLAVTTDELLLNQGDQGGKTLHVQRKRSLTGGAVTSQGFAASRVSMVLEPTRPSSPSYLRSVLDSLPVLPPTVSTITDDVGLFTLNVDPGEFNLSVRPESSTNLPWAVLSRYTVGDASTPLAALQLSIPNPVILVGQVVTLDGQAIGGARIRAWITPRSPEPMEGAPPPPPATAIQIAETTAASNGAYRLLLPASIAASISQ